MNGDNTNTKGPLVGTIVVLVILIGGALYLVGSKQQEPTPTPEPAPAATIETDTVATLQADLSSLDIDSVSNDIANYDAEVTAPEAATNTPSGI